MKGIIIDQANPFIRDNRQKPLIGLEAFFRISSTSLKILAKEAKAR